jgi:hypothetical protein
MQVSLESLRSNDAAVKVLQRTVVAECPQLVNRGFISAAEPWLMTVLQAGIAVMPAFVDAETFSTLRTSVMSQPQGTRVHIPAHKRGVTIPYATVRSLHPEVVDFYQSESLMGRIIEGSITTRLRLQDNWH